MIYSLLLFYLFYYLFQSTVLAKQSTVVIDYTLTTDNL